MFYFLSSFPLIIFYFLICIVSFYFIFEKMYSEVYDQDDVLASLATQVAQLEQRIHQREKFLQQTICTFCGGPHLRSDCNAGGMFIYLSFPNFANHECVDCRDNTSISCSRQQDDSYHTYNSEWTEQPNVDWSDYYAQGPPDF